MQTNFVSYSFEGFTFFPCSHKNKIDVRHGQLSILSMLELCWTRQTRFRSTYRFQFLHEWNTGEYSVFSVALSSHFGILFLTGRTFDEMWARSVLRLAPTRSWPLAETKERCTGNLASSREEPRLSSKELNWLDTKKERPIELFCNHF